MSNNQHNNIQATQKHFVRDLPFKAHKITGFTPELFERYYEDQYGGSIRSLNDIELKITAARLAAKPKSELTSLTTQQANFAGLITLQELFLSGLSEDGGEALSNGDLMQAFSDTFGSHTNWQAEFIKMATTQNSSTDWVVLAWSPRFKRLHNVPIHGASLALAGSLALIALDLSPNVYKNDFGTDTKRYVTSYLQSINWPKITKTFIAARNFQGHVKTPTNKSEQVSVAQLTNMMESKNNAPLILDVRHQDDRERYTSRIAETDWQDSHNVKGWANSLPKDKTVIVYCMYGYWVSQKVAEELRAKGFDARSLKGGVTAWRAMGLPSTKNEF